MWVTVVLSASFVICLFALLSSYHFFDQLVDRQYRMAHAAWVEDGRPKGYLTAAFAGNAFIRGSWQRQPYLARLLTTTPSWASADPRAIALLRRLRIAWVTMIGGFVLFFGAILAQMVSMR